MAQLSTLREYLAKATVHPEVFKLRPDYRALLIAVDGIPRGPSDETSEALLVAAELSAKAKLAQQSVNDIPHVAAWREAYKAFGTKPNKFRNSLEALTRRVEGGLPRVNRLTDIYNAISVKHQIPFGGEDLDKYSSPPFLVRASGKEVFETSAAGEKVVEHPDEGEVVWCDSDGVTCRRWNWRQCKRTALTDDSSRALFILDALEPCSSMNLTTAAEELVTVLRTLSPDIVVAQRFISSP